MAQQVALDEQNFAANDIGRLVSALLEGIRRGELEATTRDVEFLASIRRLLKQPPRSD